MKLSTVLNHINLALNYPALAYQDISLFFDQAIIELNTTLHTSIPKVSDMIEAFERKMSKEKDHRVRLTEAPENSDYVIPSYATVAEANLSTSVVTVKPRYYYVFETQKFYVLNKINNTYETRDTLEGFYLKDAQIPVLYNSMIVDSDVFWVKTLEDPILDCELATYLPDSWVILWLIPYVCYKYTCRDGGTSATFAEELQQGFQQLQETYNVPSTVLLSAVADKEAYTDIVKNALPNLNIYVPTKAIYENMKHSRALNAVYGSVYDRGGFND